MTEMPFTPPELPVSGKQSRLGIASFVVSLLGALTYCLSQLIALGYGVSLGISNPSAAQNPYQAIDTTSPLMLLSTLMAFCGPGISLIGLVLGIVSVFQKTDKKTFGIIGIVISALLLLVFCVLTGIGTASLLSGS